MDAILKASVPKLREKLLEALQAVLPIAAIVLVLCFTIALVSPSILLCFLLGAAMIVVGIMFFTLGAEMSMTPMGERVGAVITKKPEAAGDLGHRLSAGLPHHHFGAGPAGAGQSGALHPEPHPYFIGGGGRGPVSVFAFLRMPHASAAKAAGAVLRHDFLLRRFVPKEFLVVAFDSGGAGPPAP